MLGERLKDAGSIPATSTTTNERKRNEMTLKKGAMFVKFDYE
jgi:hypothetical protein